MTANYIVSFKTTDSILVKVITEMLKTAYPTLFIVVKTEND